MQWLVSLLVAVVAVCAMLAAYGFKGRPDTVGIDLGTTYSVIAIREGNHSRVFRDPSGRAIIPSMVHFSQTGDVLSGFDAMALKETYPERTIYNAKRFIGKLYNNSGVQDQIPHHPFQIMEHVENNTRSQAWFSVPEPHSKLVSPEEVGSHVLRHLLGMAAKTLGHNQISKAVVTVPAKFDGDQRVATINAYKAAGLKVMRILEEPTAAALAYGLDKKKDVKYIIVYDFGGGTLDVSLLFVHERSIQVIATRGDDMLGGADFDQCITEHLIRQGQIGADLHPPDCASSEAHICTPSTLSSLAEAMKITLSSQPTAHAQCVRPSTCERVDFEMTAHQFHRLCAPLFDRVVSPVDAVLEDASMAVDEIDEVVLVGGTSRIPHIRSLLKEKLSIDHLNVEIDPDLTVALGAASIVD